MTEGSSWCMERPRTSVCRLAVRIGRRGAHSIVGETKGGYPVQGVNNDEEDSDLVTPAFASADFAFRPGPEARLVATGRIRTSNRT